MGAVSAGMLPIAFEPYQCHCMGRLPGSSCGGARFVQNGAQRMCSSFGSNCAASTEVDASPVPPVTIPARLSMGTIIGERINGGVVHFSGIPYAKPPCGSLRWLRPEPLSAWNGQLDCTSRRPESKQRAWPMQWLSAELRSGGVHASENCLHLNIWVPAVAMDKHAPRCPVVVSMGTGGRPSSYSAHDPKMSGAAYARRNIIFVACNYRVGPLGFFHPKGGDFNCGLWDVLTVLRWVRTEINTFGGDPTCVTILGQSAGADICTCLCVSPLAKGLFRRAIIQSPSAMTMTKDQCDELTVEFASQIQAASPSLSDMQKVCAEELLKGQLTGWFKLQHGCCPGWRDSCNRLPVTPPSRKKSSSGLVYWPGAGASCPMAVPVVDGQFLLQQPMQALYEGAAAHLEIIVGSNRDEGAFWPLSEDTPGVASWDSLNSRILDHTEDVAHRFLWEIAGTPGSAGAEVSQHVEQILVAYQAERLKDYYGLGPTGNSCSTVQWMQDAIASDMISGVICSLITKRTSRPNCSRRTHRYQFNGYSGVGNALHGAELPLTLGEDGDHHPGRGRVPETREMWMNSWSSFIRTGNPNSPEMQNVWCPLSGNSGTPLFWDGFDGCVADNSQILSKRDGLLAMEALWEKLWNLTSCREE